MPDDVDRAQEVTERLLARGIRLAGEAVSGRPGSGVCVGCAAVIPAARLAALPGARECVACRAALEEAGS